MRCTKQCSLRVGGDGADPYGCTYDDIDNYLEERASEHAQDLIESAYLRTAHKRALAAAP